jgi:hypothetical protein
MPSEFRTEAVFDAFKQPLALIEDDERRRAIERYLEAARTPVERAVFDVLSELVQSLDERVAEHYRVRLAYRPGGLALEVEERVQNGEQEQWSALEGDVEKITIRIPAELKELATQAAARAGTSANTWFVKALGRALRNIEVQSAQPPPSWRRERRGQGSRLSGWVGGDE